MVRRPALGAGGQVPAAHAVRLLASWAQSEAVLPAYVVGVVLAGTVGKDHALIRRLRTLTFGLLTPFYFVRAGSFVSVPALVAAPAAFFVLLGAKMAAKFVGVFPTTRLFKSPRRESMYTTMLMSTGLTFGTISSLFGLTHHIIHQAQYSLLVAAVIGSAVVPTLSPMPSTCRIICCQPRRARKARRSRSRRRLQRPPDGCEMFKEILNANDGSANAFKALEAAADMASRYGAELHMILVEEVPTIPGRSPRSRWPRVVRTAWCARTSSAPR